MPLEWRHAFTGGLIIGLSVSIMLLASGRVTGISGIINGAIKPVKDDVAWRWFFIFGLVLGGVVLSFVKPTAFKNELSTSHLTVAVAGLLVGFGTILGSGCTSGHGICGMSRLSPRSIVATLVFIFSGMIAVVFLRGIGALS